MGPIKIVDANNLPYLYKKLKTRIDDYQTENKTELSQFQTDTEASISKYNEGVAADLSALKSDTESSLEKMKSDTTSDIEAIKFDAQANLDTLQTETTTALSKLESDAKANIDTYQSSMESSINDAIDTATSAAATAIESANKADELVNSADSKYATKEELKSAAGSISTLEFNKVDKLPDTGVSSYIYLVPATDGSGDDIYDEYIWVDTSFEKIGTTRVDLSPYLTKDSASETYLTKDDAGDNYLGKSDNAASATKVGKALTISLNGTSQGSFDGSAAKSINITPSSIGAAASSHGNHVPTVEQANNARFLRNDNSWQNITPANIGAAETDHGTHVTYDDNNTPKANGTADVGTATTVARSDHVHPEQTSVTGNAGSANKVNNALTISLNGTSQGAYDGSGAKNINITPSAIGAAAASHGTHVTFGTADPEANGTASAGTAVTVSRSDHVHPVQTSVTGNAGSADKVNNALTISLNGKSQGDYDGSEAKNINITPATIGAAVLSHGVHVSYSTSEPAANGTASAGSASTVARSDHVHPAQTSVSGNAGTADKLATPRTITLTGAVVGTMEFDGSDNASMTTTIIGDYTTGDDLAKGYLGIQDTAVAAKKLSTARKIELTGPITGSATFDGSEDIQIETSSDTYATKDDLASYDETWLMVYKALSDKVDGITSFEMTVVDALPSTGDKGTIYLIKASDGENDDIYDEYLWIEANSKFEKIGTTRVDLTPYLKSADAAGTYLTKDDATSTYLDKDSASGTYLTKNDASSTYLDKDSASGTYLTKDDATSTYLDKDSASGTYLSKNDASNTYLGKTATASSASKLSTARKIELTGPITGSVTFDGSGDVQIETSSDTYVTNDDLASYDETWLGLYDALLNKVDGITSFEMTVVDALPDTGDKGTIYLVKASDGSDGDIYDEYLWIEANSKFEKIGTTRVDLTPYLKSADASTTYLKKTETAAAAKKLSTARKIELTGPITGSATFDGSGDVQIETSSDKYITEDDLGDLDDFINSLDAFINSLGHGIAQVVDSLPDEGVPGTIYLVENGYGSVSDSYDEYVWISSTSEYECIGISSYYYNNMIVNALDNALGGITGFEVSIVDSLPSTGTDGTIYLIKASDGSDGDVYDEYLWLSTTSKFEKIGSTRVDLSQYLKSSDAAGTYLTKDDASSTYLGKTATASSATKVSNALTISLNGTSQGAYDGSAAKSINVTPAAIGAAALSHGTHVSYSTSEPAANGTASAGSASTVARSDHVHPAQTSVSGNAGSADKVNNALAFTFSESSAYKDNEFLYDGSSKLSLDITPDTIGAAKAEHGLHVEFDDVNYPAGCNYYTFPGYSDKVARADHIHPYPEYAAIAGELTNSITFEFPDNPNYFDEPTVFDGSKAATVELSPNFIGAAELAHKHSITLTGAITGTASIGQGSTTITTKVSAGTSVPTTLADGAVYYVYED